MSRRTCMWTAKTHRRSSGSCPWRSSATLAFLDMKLADLERLILQNQQGLLEAWNEFFGT